jgi:hypothetical protein
MMSEQIQQIPEIYQELFSDYREVPSVPRKGEEADLLDLDEETAGYWREFCQHKHTRKPRPAEVGKEEAEPKFDIGAGCCKNIYANFIDLQVVWFSQLLRVVTMVCNHLCSYVVYSRCIPGYGCGPLPVYFFHLLCKGYAATVALESGALFAPPQCVCP